MFLKTLLKTKSMAQNAHCLTRLLYRFVILCLYDAISTVVASRSSSAVFKYFGNGFSISLLRDFRLKHGHPNFCRNYGLHPIGEGKRGYSSRLPAGCSIRLKNSG